MKASRGCLVMMTALIGFLGQLTEPAFAERPLLLRCDQGAKGTADLLRSEAYTYHQRELTILNYWIVQFEGSVSIAQQKLLEKTGCVIHDYIPEGAYLVQIKPGKANNLRSLRGVARVIPYEPGFKVNPKLVEQQASDGYTNMLIWCFPDESDTELRRLLTYYGATILSSSDYEGKRYRVALKTELVQTLTQRVSRLSGVRWLDFAPEYKLCNNETVGIIQSGIDGGAALSIFNHGIHGEGQILGFSDTGLDIDSCYFYDSVEGPPTETINPDQRKVLAYRVWVEPNDYDGESHGTHVAGILTGDNFANPPDGIRDSGDGMAPAAKLVVQDIAYLEYLLGIPDDLRVLFKQAYDDGVRLHSNSWTEPYEWAYAPASRDVDDFMWNHKDFTLFFGIGNSGPLAATLGYPATAKDCVSVGATDAGMYADNVAWYSSHGPCEDGRLKPEVVICGGSEDLEIYSANCDFDVESYNCDLINKTGTSMATPAACGGAALIRQYFTDGFYPAGSAEPGNGFTPSSALIRAMILQSGVNVNGAFTGDDGWYDPPAPIPTMGQGWGRITLDSVMVFDDGSKRIFVRDFVDGLNTGEYHTIELTVADSGQPFEVTLAWTDYPSSLSAMRNLVNDLDLVVEHTGSGTQYLGNVYATGQSQAGGSADRINPTECVLRHTPLTGDYIITIQAHEIPIGPQPYALVITGALDFSNGLIEFTKEQYNCSGAADLTLLDDDLVGAGSQIVTVTSTSDPVGETISLMETPSGSGYFKGSIATVETAPGSGEVQVAHGDTLTLTYIDADNGSGGYNIVKTATAFIDCQPPSIESVYVIDVTDTTASVIWTTDENANSVVRYGLTTPPTSVTSNQASSFTHEVHLSSLVERTLYYFQVESTDTTGNTIIDNNGGSYYSFITYEATPALDEPMDVDPGWGISGGQWQFGAPQGLGGELDPPDGVGNPDPTSGFTGANVYGYNLGGNYSYYMSEHILTSPTFDCTPGHGAKLTYRRWLGVEGYIPILEMGDQAKIQISTNSGGSWSDIWWCYTDSYDDGEWVEHTIDISGYADHRNNIKLRWIMGPSDGLVLMCGWNIDDVRVTYLTPYNQPNLGQPLLTYEDAGGNHDGVPNAGETITLIVSLRNYGIDATNVTATMICLSPYITILEDGPISFGDIPNGGTGVSQAPHFIYEVAEDTPTIHVAEFYLFWSSSEGNGSVKLEQMFQPQFVPSLSWAGILLVIAALSLGLVRVRRRPTMQP